MKRITQARITQALVAGMGLAVAGSAFSFERFSRPYFDTAIVERVDEVVSEAAQPVQREECWNEPRDEYRPAETVRREYTPTVVKNPDGSETVTRRSEVIQNTAYTGPHYEHVCETHTAYAPAARALSYDVLYSYAGREYRARLDHDPGATLRVRVDHGVVEIAE